MKPACEVETDSVTRKAGAKPDLSPTTRAGKAATREDCEQHRENLLDSALAESFPASDPPSILRTRY